MEKTVLTWSVENWITVFLMVFLGMCIFKAGMATFRKWKGNEKTAD
jgi:hypothetical protein